MNSIFCLLATLTVVSGQIKSNAPTRVGATPAPTISPTALKNDCLNVGHSPRGEDYLVRRGVGSTSFSKPAEIGSTSELYLWWEPSNVTNCSNNITWNFTYALPASGFLNGTTFKGEGFNLYALNDSESDSNSIAVDWVCVVSFNTKPLVIVTITSTDKDGAQFANATFSFFKNCIVPAPPPISVDPGMSGTSIFFLTVFILTTVGCVVGCGINYIQQGKTGLQIVPGAVTCYALVGKCLREPRYSPQMDYDAPIGESDRMGYNSDRFGASYQTNL